MLYQEHITLSKGKIIISSYARISITFVIYKIVVNVWSEKVKPVYKHGNGKRFLRNINSYNIKFRIQSNIEYGR